MLLQSLTPTTAALKARKSRLKPGTTANAQHVGDRAAPVVATTFSCRAQEAAVSIEFEQPWHSNLISPAENTDSNPLRCLTRDDGPQRCAHMPLSDESLEKARTL